MVVENSLSTLNGMFKEVYADKIKDLIPDGVKLLNLINFAPKDKQPGNLYHQPVTLTLEHGVTFASSDDDAFNLAAPVASTMKDAQVKGNPLVLRGILGYTAASRAQQGGKQAFMDATKYLISNMLRSVARKLEAEMFYGQMGYGKIATGGVSGNVITIAAAEWAPGIWVGGENMPIEVRDSTDATSRGTAVIKSVDLDTKKLTLDSLPPGTVDGDVLWHRGAHGNEFAGIHKILTNTGSIFNIDAGTFNLFKGNEFSASSGALSFTKVQKAIAQALAKGLEGKLLCFVNPGAWANLMSDQAALRKYDSSYKKDVSETGSEMIKFHSQNGEIQIESSIYVKEGFSYLLSMDDYERIGSQDVSFKIPGQGEQYFQNRPDSAAYELRIFTDQALFCRAPGRSVIIKDIVNS